MKNDPFLDRIFRGLQADLGRELELAWLRQLEKDYDQICYQFGLKLKKPILTLMDSDSVWGTWDTPTRTLSLNRELIRKHSWAHVLAVLKHEMAHQVASELMGSCAHHDATFRAACESLGLASPYWRASIPLSEEPYDWKRTAPEAEEQRILRKAERLLALAGSQNEHEATSAMEKVREILAKHSIGIEKARQKSHHVSLTIETGRKRLDRTLCRIAGILNDFYLVRVVYSSLYDARLEDSFKTIELMGLRENVLMSEYVFHFLSRTVDNLWKTYQLSEGAEARDRLSYQTGLLTGLRRKLQGAEKRSKVSLNGDEKALLLVSEKKLDDYVRTQYPKLATRRGSSQGVTSGAYHSGCRDGEKIIIHKGIENKGVRGGRLLAAGR